VNHSLASLSDERLEIPEIRVWIEDLHNVACLRAELFAALRRAGLRVGVGIRVRMPAGRYRGARVRTVRLDVVVFAPAAFDLVGRALAICSLSVPRRIGSGGSGGSFDPGDPSGAQDRPRIAGAGLPGAWVESLAEIPDAVRWAAGRVREFEEEGPPIRSDLDPPAVPCS
jgi:hypothetical protein